MGNLWKLLKDATGKYGGFIIAGAVAMERYLANKELKNNKKI